VFLFLDSSDMAKRTMKSVKFIPPFQSQHVHASMKAPARVPAGAETNVHRPTAPLLTEEEQIGIIIIEGVAHLSPRRTAFIPPTLLLPNEIQFHVTLTVAVQLWDGKICAFQQR